MSFYITTSISYVNGNPHLGHAYEAIATDVVARHRRQRGEEVFFLTGTDEHGEPVADSAKANGMEPREWADLNAAKFVALLPRLNVHPDFFIRTTDPEHQRRVQEVLKRVYDNGYVHKGTYEGWYCPRCADFKVENEILEGNRCPIHEIALTREHEENYFFALSRFQERLEAWFAEHPDFIAPARARNEALAFLNSGLQDISLSRAKLSWGVQVPWDPSHVFYVWFDALLNYYTAPGFARPGEDRTAELWPADVHMIGKDILKFHTIYWPALLMAAGLEPPRSVFVHGHLAAADGRKMSKSLGNGIDPLEVVEEYEGPDPLRYYLMRDVRYGTDGPVGREQLAARYTSELANEYGNLASRTLAMIVRYRDGIKPPAQTDDALVPEFEPLADAVARALDQIDITGALELIWQRVRRLNRYVEEQKPWELAKDPELGDRLDRVLASLYEGLRIVSALLWPYLPGSTETVLTALGTDPLNAGHFALSRSAVTVQSIAPLFPKRT